MKLIDLLVRELPKRGGWPKLAKKIHQDHDGEVRGWINEDDPQRIFTLDQVATNARPRAKDETYENMVTRDQYEAAIAAAQQPVWDGEGLPPVGCECEISVCGGWEPGRIVFSDENIGVAYVCESSLSPTLDCVSGFSALKHFRPIRSEADRRRDEIAKDINAAVDASGTLGHVLYDAIAAGKIPHIRIE
ncbi:hypothetical protein [Cronobacter malonaticus]|uniref:hypothetical protein n=1 Tax=Cronobacter malonaticus TaxID=413503 RepID=UPI000CFDF2C5|nr:hypothetical protein [Cronobacter malonaticus]